MGWLKKIIFLLGFLFLATSVQAADSPHLYFFWSQTCPHCHQQQQFLDDLVSAYPQIRIESHEIHQPQSYQLLQQFKDQLNIDSSGVPVTIIGDQYIVGFLSDETTGRDIKQALNQQHNLNLPLEEANNAPKNTVNLPLIGSIDLNSLSLPLLTLVVGFLDGFNPCAMWVLVFLISLLLGLQDRRRLWLLGFAFIAASAFVYFLFLSAWLNLFLFIGFLKWVQILVGLVALGSGLYYLYDFYTNPNAACKVGDAQKKQQVFGKLKAAISKENLLLALVGIVLLAFAVNLIELVCSAGLPAIYTNILSQANLPSWQYYSYLLLYTLIFMIDDLVIFIIAIITFKTTNFTAKYSRFSHLIGGLLMLFIAFALIFKPQLLTF